MLKKNKEDYYLTHYSSINESIETIKTFFAMRLEGDKILKKLNHEAYEKIMKKIKSFKSVPEHFTLEEILLFTQSDLIATIESIPRKIYKLEKNGYSLSGFTPKEEVINTNKITEHIYNLIYYLPKRTEYLICKPEKLTPKFRQFLVKNKLYKIISLFRYEEIAKDLRSEIEITPLLNKSSTITLLLQKYGLTPQTNFIKMKPSAKDTIIYLGNGQPQIYYNSLNFLNIGYKYSGINPSFEKAGISPIETTTIKAKPLKIGSGKIYETYDGILFRQMDTPFKDRFKRGISPIANGYNSLFNKKFSKYITAPIISPLTFGLMKEFNKQKYKDFMNKNRKITKSKLIDKFLLMLMKTIDVGDNKFLNHELKISIQAEKLKLSRKLSNSLTIAEFFEDVIADKDNFILKFERKIKIFNARREKKVDGGKATKKSNKEN